MAKKAAKPRRLYIPVVPAGASWIESDSYDRRAWSDIGLGAPAIGELVEAGRRLVPHFDALLGDLFFALFKYNLVWLKTDAVRKSAILNHTILDRLVASPAFEALKSRTLLEEDKAAIAALALAEQALELVRSERLLNRRELLDLWDLHHQEEDLGEARRRIEGDGGGGRAGRWRAPARPGAEKKDREAQRGGRARRPGLRGAAQPEGASGDRTDRPCRPGRAAPDGSQEPRPRAGDRSRRAGQP